MSSMLLNWHGFLLLTILTNLSLVYTHSTYTVMLRTRQNLPSIYWILENFILYEILKCGLFFGWLDLTLMKSTVLKCQSKLFMISAVQQCKRGKWFNHRILDIFCYCKKLQERVTSFWPNSFCSWVLGIAF